MKLTGKRKSKTFTRLIELVGVEATRKLLAEYGGQTLYVPKLEIFFGRQRNWKIAEEYESGEYSQQQLAEKWSLSQSQIQRIVKQVKEERKSLSSRSDG